MKKPLFSFLTLLSLSGYCQDSSVALINTVKFKLPGKDWTLIGHYEVGGQYTFKNNQTKVAVTLSARDKNKFDFFNDSLTNFDLVTTFYKWDADYWRQSPNSEVSQLKSDSTKNYIIWYLKVPKGSNYSLYGLKNDRLVGLSIGDKMLPKNEAIELLETIYFR
jgi:hypothetical protein